MFFATKGGGRKGLYQQTCAFFYIAVREIVFLNKKTRFRQGRRDHSVFIFHS